MACNWINNSIKQLYWAIRWAGHVSSMGEYGNAHNVLVVKPKGNRDFEDRSVDGRLILKLSCINRMGGL